MASDEKGPHQNSTSVAGDDTTSSLTGPTPEDAPIESETRFEEESSVHLESSSNIPKRDENNDDRDGTNRFGEDVNEGRGSAPDDDAKSYVTNNSVVKSVMSAVSLTSSKMRTISRRRFHQRMHYGALMEKRVRKLEAKLKRIDTAEP